MLPRRHDSEYSDLVTRYLHSVKPISTATF